MQASATAEAQDATAAGGELQFTPELVFSTRVPSPERLCDLAVIHP
ncbi:hypothetical protein [Neobacillus drentensis]